jgi:hypothetical protein
MTKLKDGRAQNRKEGAVCFITYCFGGNTPVVIGWDFRRQGSIFNKGIDEGRCKET